MIVRIDTVLQMNWILYETYFDLVSHSNSDDNVNEYHTQSASITDCHRHSEAVTHTHMHARTHTMHGIRRCICYFLGIVNIILYDYSI